MSLSLVVHNTCQQFAPPFRDLNLFRHGRCSSYVPEMALQCCSVKQVIHSDCKTICQTDHWQYTHWASWMPVPLHESCCAPILPYLLSHSYASQSHSNEKTSHDIIQHFSFCQRNQKKLLGNWQKPGNPDIQRPRSILLETCSQAYWKKYNWLLFTNKLYFSTFISHHLPTSLLPPLWLWLEWIGLGPETVQSQLCQVQDPDWEEACDDAGWSIGSMQALVSWMAHRYIWWYTQVIKVVIASSSVPFHPMALSRTCHGNRTGPGRVGSPSPLCRMSISRKSCRMRVSSCSVCQIL